MPLPNQIDPQFKPQTDAAEHSVITQIRPLSLINNSNVLQFIIPKYPDACIDAASTRIAVEFQILKADGTACTVVAPKYLTTINSQLDSLFSGMAISINGEQIISTSNNHILSYFMKNLNYSAEFRKSVLYAGHYIETTAGMEGSQKGTAFNKLATFVKDSKKVKVAGALSHPFFQTQKFLPPETEIGITLTQSSPELFLLTDIEDKLKISILDCYLMVRLVKLENNLQLALKEAIAKAPFIYPFKHTVIKAFTLGKGISNTTLHNAFYGILPSRIFALQVATDAYLGSLTKSPFALASNNLTEFRLNFNGINIPLEKFTFAMPGDGELLYEHLNNVLKINTHQITPSYTYDRFVSDGFFVCESLITDCSSSQTTLPFVQGSVSVELVFSAALTDNVTLILIGEYSRSHISIEKSGAVKLIEQ